MQFKYIVATIASLSISSVLAGPMPGALNENSLTARDNAHLQDNAVKLVNDAKSGRLTNQDGLTAQQRLDAAHAQYTNVKVWYPYWIDDWCCYPGTLSYDYSYSLGFGYCGYW